MANPIRILYADSKPGSREEVRQLLSREAGAFAVIEAASDEEVRSALKEGEFDLVLAEAGFSEESGTLLEVIRNATKLPVVIVAQNGNAEAAVAALRKGAADYVSKGSSDLTQLPARLRAVLENNLPKPADKSADDLARENELLRRRLEQADEHIQSISKELESFAYSVSHDLRAPLRAMEGFARILLEDFADQLDEEPRRYLEVITNSAENMHRLIDDLLAFSRLSRADFIPMPIDLEGLANSLVREFAQAEPDRKVSVTVRPMPGARADGEQIKKLLFHLISNAFKFTRPNPEAKIEIGAKDTNQGPAYYVKDNGVGFDMRYGSKLFGVFQRLHRSDEFEGSGIGLAMCQRIIRRHGGAIWFESAPGQGSTFYFTLPVDENAAVEFGSAEPSDAAPPAVV